MIDSPVPTTDLSETQARTMLSMQAQMNARVDPAWVQAAYPYMRAVVIEAAEAIEHHGWKWWKKQKRDLPQLQMELIDIWHFMLSQLLLDAGGDEEEAYRALMTQIRAPQHAIDFDKRLYRLTDLDLLAKLELLIGTGAARRVVVSLFAAIMRDCELQWQDVYAQYVSKNVLNFFRQNHGYKEGTYRKIWQEREDNEHLVEIMSELDPLDEQYQEMLYARLAERYLK
jgi:dimeric dUTPase (all-alpha-NTP-PPase superfamily)